MRGDLAPATCKQRCGNCMAMGYDYDCPARLLTRQAAYDVRVEKDREIAELQRQLSQARWFLGAYIGLPWYVRLRIRWAQLLYWVGW